MRAKAAVCLGITLGLCTSLYFMHALSRPRAAFAQLPLVSERKKALRYRVTALPGAPSVAWERKLSETALYAGMALGSPLLVHVDQDGCPDVVVSVGHLIHGSGIVAVNGRTGHSMWQAPLPMLVFATPVLSSRLELVIVGTHRNIRRRASLPPQAERASDVVALAVGTGHMVWSLRASNSQANIPDLNFGTVTCQGLRVYALCSGGFDDGERPMLGRAWNDRLMRPAALLFVLDSTSGTILARLQPQPREAYGVIVPLLNGDLVFGSGGETVPGRLHRLQGTPPHALVWQGPLSETKGWVATPVTTPSGDIVAASFDGNVACLAGSNGTVRWQRTFLGLEMHSSPALGDFDGDGAWDVVTVGNAGVFPRYVAASTILWLRGRDGALLRQTSLGFYTVSSPLAVDLTDDGWDETVVVCNYSPSVDIPFLAMGQGPSVLHVVDGRSGALIFNHTFAALSFATPVLGDHDGDGYWDVVHISADATVYRIPLPFLMAPPWKWLTLSGLQYPAHGTLL